MAAYYPSHLFDPPTTPDDNVIEMYTARPSSPRPNREASNFRERSHHTAYVPEHDLKDAPRETEPFDDAHDYLRRGTKAAGFGLLIDFFMGIKRKAWKETPRKVPEGSYADTETYVEKLKTDFEELGVEWPTVDIVFKNLHFEVDDRTTKQKKVLLHDVSGVFEAGSMVAIMGPSGCGKTTLMDCIAGKKTAPYTGEVRVNGGEVDKATFNKITGYVPQQDYGLPRATVFEELMFNLELQRDYDIMSKDKKKQREFREQDANVLLEAVGLSKVKDSYVGDALVRGISGGQKRRLTLLKALCTGPAIVFMDEPTSGLSSTDSERVIKTCKLLAQHLKVTFVVVIHQPRISLFNLFDKVMFMSEGKVAYNGKRSELESFFGEMGYTCPHGENPADYYLDLITPGVPGADPEKVIAHFERSRSPQIEREVEEALTQPRLAPLEEQMAKYEEKRPKHKTPSKVYQWWQLQKREFRQLPRAWPELLVLVCNAIILGLLIGFIYLNIRTKNIVNGVAQSIPYQLGCLFLLAQMGAFMAFEGLPILINERLLFLNERDAGLYSTGPYMLAKYPMRMMHGFLQVTILLVISYFMAGFEARYFAWLWLVSLATFFSVDGLMTFLASLSSSHSTANALAATVLTIMSMFNGYLANAESSPEWIIWIQFISPLYYAFVAATAELFENYCCFPWTCSTQAAQFPSVCEMGTTDRSGISDQYDINTDLKVPYVIILLVFALFYNVCAYLVQKFHVKLEK